MVYVSNEYIESTEIDIVLRDEAGIDVTTLYNINSSHLTLQYDEDAAYANGFRIEEEDGTYRIYATKPQKQLPITAIYYDITNNGKKELIAKCTKTFVSIYDPKTELTSNDIEAVGLYKERTEYDEIVQTNLKTAIAADDDTMQLVTMAKNGWGEKIEQDAFTYTVQEKNLAMVSSDGQFTPLKKGVAHVVVFYTNPYRLNEETKSVYRLEIQITEDRHIEKLSVETMADTITGHVMPGEYETLEELDNMESKAVYYVTVLDSFGENCTEYAYENQMISLSNPDIFQMIGYDELQEAICIEVDGKNETVIQEITSEENVKKRQVRFVTDIVATNEFGKQIKEDIAVFIKKPDTLEVKRYEIEAQGIDVTNAKDDTAGTIAVKLYGLNSAGLRVADLSESLKYVASVDEGEKLPAGSFFYTISRDGNVLNAKYAITSASSSNIEVVENRIIDLVHLVSAKTSVGNIDVLAKAAEAEYDLVLYQVTERDCKKIQRITVPVKNRLTNALSVKVLKTTTDWPAFKDKSGWSVDADVALIINDTYHFTFGDTVLKDVPINAKVTVKGKTMQVKQIKVYVPIEDEYYLEYITSVRTTILLEE